MAETHIHRPGAAVTMSLVCFAVLILMTTPVPANQAGSSNPAAEKAEGTGRPTLTGDVAQQVAGLDKRIEELKGDLGDAALAETLNLAEMVLAIRLQHQGPGAGWTDEKEEPAEWWEVSEARLAVEDIRRLQSMTAQEREAVAEAVWKKGEGWQLRRKGELDQAELLLRDSLATLSRLFGEARPDLIRIVNNLAWVNYDKSNYAMAEMLFRNALAMQASLPNGEHPEVARTMNGLASLLHKQSKLEEAEQQYRQALAMRRRLLGSEDFYVSGTMSNLAMVLMDKGRYEEAEPLIREALVIDRKVLGNYEPDIAKSLNMLGSLLRAMGRYGEAEACYRESLAIYSKVFGADNQLTAEAMANLGLVLKATGDYTAAELYYRRSLPVLRQALGDDHPNLAQVMNNLPSVLEMKGDRAAAEQFCWEALEIRKKAFGPEHPVVADNQNNLANLLKSGGDLQAAEALYREALKTRRKVLGDGHLDVAGSLNHLGGILQEKGDYAGAESLFLEALGIYRELLGDEHPKVAENMRNLAVLYLRQGDFAEAEPLLHGALAINREFLGDDHPAVTRSLNSLASLQYDKGNYSAAEQTWSAAARSFEAARLRVGSGGMERVRFTAMRSPLIPLAACRARIGKVRPAWECLEDNLARGLLDTLSARNSRVMDSAEHDLQEKLIGRLDRIETQRKTLLDNKEETEANSAILDQNREEWEKLQAELVTFEEEMTGKYGVAAGEVFPLARIQAQLAEDTALLAWVDLEGDPHAADPNGQHWACVVRHRGEPRWIRLPGSNKDGAWTKADDQLAGQLRQELGHWSAGPAAENRREIIRRLHAQRIAPVLTLLAGVRRLVVCPAGWMAGVPVEALTPEFTVSYAPSGTIYAWLGEQTADRRKGSRASGPDSLLALGDPVFPPDSPYVPIPHTRHEVEAIARLFAPAVGDEDAGGKLLILLGSQASEQRLDSLAGAGRLETYRYLHLATHGVMDDRMAMNSAMILAQDNLPDSYESAMAGKEIFDGRLTAGQIVRAWKLDADLVTLSGCETALGEDSGGEGFIGFSQALFVAGAKSLLLSLWKVDDLATMLLMNRFYESLWGQYDETRRLPDLEWSPGEKIPKAEALREAKLWLQSLTADQLDRLRLERDSGVRGAVRKRDQEAGPSGHHPYEDPRFWASFILIGNPD